jgi:hypothetical protein
MAAEDRSPEHEHVASELSKRLLEVISRVAPGGNVVGEIYYQQDEQRDLEVHLSYGRWRLGQYRGADPIDLIAKIVGFGPVAALAFAANALGIDLKKLKKRERVGGVAGRHQAVLPVPAEAPALDWEHEPQDELFWRRLGSAERAVARWEYRDSANRLLLYTCRFQGEGAKYYRRLAYFGPAVGWRLDDKTHSVPRPWPLYGLPGLRSRPEARVLVVEGEKTRDAAAKLLKDYVVVAWLGGADSVEHGDWELLRGRDVTLWPDADVYGREAMDKLQGVLRRFEAARVSIVKLAELSLPVGWDLADEPPEGIEPLKLLEQARALPAWATELNKQHFVVLDGGSTVVMREDHDPVLRRRILRRLTFTDMRNFYDDRTAFGFDPRGNAVQLGIGTLWLAHPERRKFNGMVMDPGGEHAGYYNMWRGFSVKPVQGDWPLFRAHMRDVICSGDATADEYLIHWCAQLVQKPNRPGGSAVVMRGPRGTGKSTFALAIGALVSEHFLHLAQPGLLTGRFNAHLRDAIVVFGDEAFWAGDRAGESFLKSIVTEPTLTLEGKGKDAIIVPNMVHLIMASNHEWVVPAGTDERRFFVLDVNGDDRPPEYYASIRDELHHEGGLEAMLYDLLNLDLASWDAFTVPSTKGLVEQKLLTLDSFQSWWLRKLREGVILPGQKEWPRVVSCESVYADFSREQQQRRLSYIQNEVSFGMLLHKFFKGDRRFKRRRDVIEVTTLDHRTGDEYVTQARTWVYHLPPLEDCRLRFDTLLKLTRSSNWDDEVLL